MWLLSAFQMRELVIYLEPVPANKIRCKRKINFSGELPRAYVVRKNRDVMEQSIIDWVAERVAPHKKLGAGVMFVDTLPKNQTGKILRRELKAQVFKGSFGY